MVVRNENACINSHMCLEFAVVSQYERRSEFLANLTEFIAKDRASSRHIHLFDLTFAFLQIYTKGIGSFTREVNSDLTSTTSTTNLIYLLAYQMCLTYPLTNQFFKNRDNVVVLVVNLATVELELTKSQI